MIHNFFEVNKRENEVKDLLALKKKVSMDTFRPGALK